MHLGEGEVVIGVDDIICKHYLLPYIENYHNKYPKVKIKTLNISTHDIVVGLKDGSISFGIIKTPFEDDRIQIDECFDIDFCFVVGKKYKQLSQGEISIKELLNYALISHDKTSTSRTFIDEYFLANGLKFCPEIELSNFDLISQFARIGLGIGCVIENFIQEELNKGELFKLNIFEKITRKKVAVATLKGLSLSEPAKKFVSSMFNS